MDAREAFATERRAMASTLRDVGPDGPTLCGTWTARDLAAHVVSMDLGGAVLVFLGRWLVARGVRLNDRMSSTNGLITRLLRRRGFEWAIKRLERRGPRLLYRPSVVTVSLFEVWVHHEDVRRANGRGPDPAREHAALEEALHFIARYQRRHLSPVTLIAVTPDGREVRLGAGTVTVRGPLGEVVLWLAGRRAVAEVSIEGTAAATDVLEAIRV